MNIEMRTKPFCASMAVGISLLVGAPLLSQAKAVASPQSVSPSWAKSPEAAGELFQLKMALNTLETKTELGPTGTAAPLPGGAVPGGAGVRIPEGATPAGPRELSHY